MTAIEFLNLGGLFKNTRSLVVAAKRCRRIRIKDDKVDEFLEKHVLSNASAVQALQRWISITKSDYMKRIVSTRSFGVPHVWMLTGLYQLDDARAFRTTERVLSMETGIGTEIMTALGVPVSAGLHVETNRETQDRGTWVGPKVWAARYQLLHLRYRFVGSGIALPGLSLPLQMRQVYTPGGFLSADSDSDSDEDDRTENVVTIESCADEEAIESDGDQDYTRFYEAFDDIEKKWNEAATKSMSSWRNMC